ncbi:MAG: hypothetical protein QOG04_1193 [Actinomycetota bacterium]|nr:hypothetical protein [Actinomycetota bacterium]
MPTRWVLASSDLNARARVLEAAGDADVVTTDATGFRSSLAGAAVLILDLDEGGTDALDELIAARAADEEPERVIGFMSHVDRELGRKAREAGCRPIARGRFWAHLHDEAEGPTDPSS